MQTLRSRLGRLKRPGVPPTIMGIVALMRVLPKVSPAKAAVGAVGIFASALLPIAVATATGFLIGAAPSALHGGFGSTAGHHLIVLLVVAGVLVLAQQAVGPMLMTLGE